MTNPTTVRLTPEQQAQVGKLADLHRISQSAVFAQAIACLWSRDGQRAEYFAKLREETPNVPG